MSAMDRQASLKEQLARVPDAPGVYLWKDAAGEVLYVGKAKSLARRMASYLSRDVGTRISLMVAQATSFDFIVTANEVESLILECTLIKRHRPPFNVRYRDDKSYPFIAVTTGDTFPRIHFTREKHKPDTRYFGPYTDARAARATIETLKRVFPLRTCRGEEPGRGSGSPCLSYHIERCLGPCVGAVTPEAYGEVVGQVSRFLSGKERQVREELERSMREAAGRLDFERAARLRNRVRAADSVLAKQKVVGARSLDLDVVGVASEPGIAAVQLMSVRRGVLVASDAFILDKGDEMEPDELLEGWMLAHYSEASHVPREFVSAVAPRGQEALEAWLTALRGGRGKVRLTVARRGDRLRMRELADENARQSLIRFMTRTRFEEDKANEALSQLRDALQMPSAPFRIECYDISNISGKQAVGSMVVFTGGFASKKEYRRFRIRLPGEPNDVAMTAEVLRRRFKRHAEQPTGRFATLVPDLVIVDGGLPQLGAARQVMGELGIDDVALAALAKKNEELYVPDRAAPVRLAPASAGLHLLQRIRDEAHRFAVEYHRELRGKAMTRSALDDIAGVGPVTRKKLLRHFSSMAKMRAATVDELRAARVTRPQAEAVHDRLAAGRTD
jgi:excinuclease ABC subunit C